MKALLAAAVLGAFLLIVPAAHAEEVTRLDRDHGVRFTLDGRVLTVRLVPQSGRRPPDIRDEVWGERIRATCTTTYNPRRFREQSVHRTRRWARGRLELAFMFPRPVSDRARACLLEKGGTDVAAADFGIFIAIHAAGAADRRAGQALRRYLVRQSETRPWIRRVKALVIDRGAIIVSTDLRRDLRGRRIARALCALVRDSGVPSAPPGYVIYARDDERLRRC